MYMMIDDVKIYASRCRCSRETSLELWNTIDPGHAHPVPKSGICDFDYDRGTGVKELQAGLASVSSQR